MAETSPNLPLDSIVPPTTAPDETADTKTEEELRHLRAMHELEHADYGQDIDLRKKYADKVFVLVCVWLGFTLLIFIASGFSNSHFKISEKALIALITGTTVDVLGLFAIVCNYLFPKRPADLKKKSKPSSPHARPTKKPGR